MLTDRELQELHDPGNGKVCKFCKHWQRLVGPVAQYRLNNFYGQCGNEKLVEGETPDHSDGLVYYSCSDYHGASIETGENFGCIHWEGL